MTGRFRRALVIFNPTAGSRHRRRLDAALGGIGCPYELKLTERRGDAEEAARTAAEQGYDLVVVGGGDGTINEVANGLAAGAGAPPLAVIPLGSANVTAAEIGLSHLPEALSRLLARGRRKTVRLGWTGERYFVLMASVGLDAEVVRGLDPALKRRIGRTAYLFEALRRVLRYDFPEFSVVIDGIPHRARMAVVCRARHYGGPFELAPAADMGDERLHVALLRRGGLLAMLRYGLSLAGGRLSRLADVEMVSGTVVSIDGPAGAPVQADGDLIGETPIEITVSRRTIDLMVP
ncbi:MAG: YegS/Rv2252/BmrU family lipid kinase [Alphaproteobacteria bacterium]|nr:YegS/Rv2252/BmrU family lipid kinase [Alphaproteobacteria bacterium]